MRIPKKLKIQTLSVSRIDFNQWLITVIKFFQTCEFEYLMINQSKNIISEVNYRKENFEVTMITIGEKL